MKGQRGLLLKGAAWVTAATVLVNLLGLASLFLLTRLLAPEDFGLVAIAMAFVGIVGVVTELTLATALIQRREVKPVHFDTAWTMNVLRAAVVAVLFLALSAPVAAFYEDERLGHIVQALALSTLIGGCANPRLVVFQRELDFSKGFIMQMAQKLAAFSATVTVALVYQSYWALVVGAVAASIANVIMSYVLIPYRPRFSLGAWRELLSFSVWLTFGKWVEAINWRAQPLLYGFILPTSVLGQLNVGQRLLGRTLDQAVTPVRRVLFPAYSRLQDDKARLRTGYMRAQGTICLITLPLAAGFALLAEDLVVLTVGEQWLPAVPAIQLLALVRMVQSLQNVNSLGLATANTKALFIRNVYALLIRWPFIVAGLYLGGEEPFERLIGALMGQCVAVLIIFVVNTRLIAKLSTISLRDHAAFAWRPFVSVTVMALIVALAQAISPPVAGWLWTATRVLTLAAIGATVYFGCLYLLWRITGRITGQGDTLELELAGLVKDLIAKATSKARAGIGGPGRQPASQRDPE